MSEPKETTQSPTISVIMAVHNGEKYLREAVESILHQTYRHFEFIIINDASTDSSPDILKSFADKRIVILTNSTNQGLTKSLNIGLRNARAPYVARMDADDISLPCRLHDQKEFLDGHHDIVAVGTAVINFNNKNDNMGIKAPPSDPELLKFYLTIKNQMIHSSVMFRKQTILDLGGYNENMEFVQDYELWSRLISKNYRLTNLQTPLVKYRLHESSITQGNTRERAYALSRMTVYKNISRYIQCDQNEFDLFIDAVHRHQITSLKQALITRRVLQKFHKAYIEKEKPGKENIVRIQRYIETERRGALLWYAKYRFGMLYNTIAWIRKF